MTFRLNAYEFHSDDYFNQKNNAPNSEMAAESFCDPCIVLIASVRTDFSMNHCYSENLIVILSKCLNKHFNGNFLTSH